MGIKNAAREVNYESQSASLWGAVLGLLAAL